MKTPTPTPEQALRVLEILGKWTERGWWYEVTYDDLFGTDRAFAVYHANPDQLNRDELYGVLTSRGVNHFDALCQAATVMQVLLEEHPENP